MQDMHQSDTTLYPASHVVAIDGTAEMSAQEQIEWQLNKVSVDDAHVWKRAGFAPWDAYYWQCASESPVFERFKQTQTITHLVELQIEFAKAWLSVGIHADQAFRWSMCDFAPVDAAEWIKHGITNVDLAARYRDEGHRP
jgi:hypothetical protein